MTYPLNIVCKFTWATKYDSLNGPYKITEITTFEEALTDGVDFTDSFYTPAGLADSDFTADVANFLGCTVFKLVSALDSTVTIWCPQPTLSAIPDPTVKRYDNVYMNASIGIFASSDQYTYIESQIADMIAAITGQSSVIIKWMANPKMAKWMTDKEYATMDAARQLSVKKIVPLTTQIAALQARVTALTNKCAEYEQSLIAIAKGAKTTSAAEPAATTTTTTTTTGSGSTTSPTTS